MKPSDLLSIVSIFLFTVFSAASSWPDLFAHKMDALLVPRQASSGSSSASATVSNSASGSSSAGGSQTTNASGSASVSGSGSNSITSATRTGTVSGSGSRNSTTTKTSAIDPRLPPGGIQMLIPAATAGATFVKVGNQITFAWNYTSLSVPPSYIDVVATNTVNSQTYTIAANQSWQATQSVTWDTGEFAATNTLPFVVATYTLMIYDAAKEPTAVASAGYLGSFSNLQFGIYTPQAYTPLNEFKCATCSGAISLHEKQALGVLLGTCVVTILSFTWFASGFGVF